MVQGLGNMSVTQDCQWRKRYPTGLYFVTIRYRSLDSHNQSEQVEAVERWGFFKQKEKTKSVNDHSLDGMFLLS